MKNEEIEKLPGGNIDIDLATPEEDIAWAQAKCPWNEAENTTEHRCAVKNTSICSFFCGLDYPDILLCSWPNKNPKK